MFDGYEQAGRTTGRSTALACNAMVSSPNSWATAVGLEVLRNGGNAVDASVAVSGALMVAVPHQCSPGGDAFWLIRPPGGPTWALNASGRSAGSASPSELLALGYTSIPERSAASVTVPGVVDGWIAASQRFASRGLPELLGPAIQAARRGIPATPYLARQLKNSDPLLTSRLESSRVFRPTGRPIHVGERMPLPDLANTLAILADDPRALYDGPLAARVSQAVLNENGWITPEDLRIHHSEWTEPVSGRFRDWMIEEFPPNSQGWLALLTLRLAECMTGPATRTGWTHRLIQAAQVVYALRDSVLADRGFMQRPPEWYFEPAQLAALADLAPLRSETLARAGWYRLVAAGLGDRDVAGSTSRPRSQSWPRRPDGDPRRPPPTNGALR